MDPIRVQPVGFQWLVNGTQCTKPIGRIDISTISLGRYQFGRGSDPIGLCEELAPTSRVPMLYDQLYSISTHFIGIQ